MSEDPYFLYNHGHCECGRVLEFEIERAELEQGRILMQCLCGYIVGTMSLGNDEPGMAIRAVVTPVTVH